MHRPNNRSDEVVKTETEDEISLNFEKEGKVNLYGKTKKEFLSVVIFEEGF